MKKKMSDIPGLIVQVQQQLTYLDKKIDALIGQLSTRPHEAAQRVHPAGRPEPSQRFDRPARQGGPGQANNHRELVLHKTICADCRKECNVPFKPSGDRPVYCKECYARRKASSSVKMNIDGRLREEGRSRARPSHKHAGGENRRPYAKKVFNKKWKKRP